MTCFIGLSGGIGSGKSTVSRLLNELGAIVVDADAIVHELQAAGQPMLKEIAAAFGDGVLTDDSTEEARRVLRRLVDGLAGERRGRRGQRPGRG